VITILAGAFGFLGALLAHDLAAQALAEALRTDGMHLSRPTGGRVNLRAAVDGLLVPGGPDFLPAAPYPEAVAFSPADAAQLTFDRALLVTVLGEIPDRVAALQEIRGSLKPGGLLSVTEVFPDPHYQRRDTVRQLAQQAGLEVRETYGTWRAHTTNLARPAEDATHSVESS